MKNLRVHARRVRALARTEESQPKLVTNERLTADFFMAVH
jgi:hypothetical protein